MNWSQQKGSHQLYSINLVPETPEEGRCNLHRVSTPPAPPPTLPCTCHDRQLGTTRDHGWCLIDAVASECGDKGGFWC